MALENFFEKGNKLAVFGSFIYNPKSANDLDFTLFTHQGKNPFYNPERSRLIRRFLRDQFGHFTQVLDFSGDTRDCSMPYDIDDLPNNDPRLDGYLLTARIFPDDSFLADHFRNEFGAEYLTRTFLRYIQYVRDIPESRRSMGWNFGFSKKYKDVAAIISAAKNFVKRSDSKMHGLEQLTEEYQRRYDELTAHFNRGEINIETYSQKGRGMLYTFIFDIEDRHIFPKRLLKGIYLDSYYRFG